MKLIVKKYGNSVSGDLFDVTVTTPRVHLPRDCLPEWERGKRDRAASSISRAISAVRSIGLSNNWDYFVTFTFRDGSVPDVLDYADMAKRLGRRMRHLREDNPGYDCGYLIIPELHPKKRERIHFHGLLRDLPPDTVGINKYGWLDFFPFAKSFGHVNIQPVNNTVAAVFYCIKYICKDLSLVKSNDKDHLYYCSRGLDRPREIMRKNISSPDRLLLESGLQFNEDYGFYARKQCSKEVADCILDYISDPFLNRALSPYYTDENLEVVNYAKSDVEGQGRLCFGRETREEWETVPLFDV